MDYPRERAVRILNASYGVNPGTISDGDRAWLEGQLLPEHPQGFGPDTILDVLQRIVGDNYNWRDERSWEMRAQHFAQVR